MRNYHDLKREVNSIALVDTNQIKFLTDKDGISTYEPVEIEGLPKVPIVVYPKTVNINGTKISKLTYRLLLPKVQLPSLFIEQYIDNGEISFESIPNENAEGSLVVYDNEDTHTIRNILASKEITLEYIHNHKREIYELAGRVISKMNNPKTKTLK